MSIPGERAQTTDSAVSAQSRVSNALALGLMMALGVGGLTWYYVHTLLRHDRERESALAASAKRVQGDFPLPSLGRIDAPHTPVPAEAPSSPDPGLDAGSPRLVEIPLAAGPPFSGAGPSVPAPGVPPPKTAAQLALERQLSATVFATRSAVPTATAVDTAQDGGKPPGSAAPTSELAALLRPSTMTVARASLLPAQRLLLPKGAFIDCTLETAIDSTLPGMTTCVTATDTFGVDGRVVLLERGTKLVGETRGQVQQGAARLFVLWTEARTPAGVVVPLDSPGTDELGRSGLTGEINRHFWQRFGAAMLVSVIDGAVEAAAQSSRGSGGSVIVNPSGAQNVLTEILKSTIGIAPTITKHNGDRIQILVARDVDFRTVYELRHAAGR